MVWLNSHNVRDLRTPFGGVKASGLGHEGGYRSIDFYTDQQAVHITLGTVHTPKFGASSCRAPRRYPRPLSKKRERHDQLRPHPHRPGPGHRPLRLHGARRHRPRGKSREFYVDVLGPARHRGGRERRSTCAPSRSSSTTTWCCARARWPPSPRSPTGCARPRTSTRAEAFYRELGCRVERRKEGFTKGIGDSVRVEDPLGLPLRVLLRGRARRAPRLALRPLHRRRAGPPRPLQPGHPGRPARPRLPGGPRASASPRTSRTPTAHATPPGCTASRPSTTPP